MSQPKRYVNGRYGLDPHESGEWVMWSDYASLAAENERLRKAGDRLASATIIFETMSEEERAKRRADWLAAKEGGDAK